MYVYFTLLNSNEYLFVYNNKSYNTSFDQNHAKKKYYTNCNKILTYILYLLNFHICWMMIKK